MNSIILSILFLITWLSLLYVYLRARKAYPKEAIEELHNLITDISEQTTLLALNVEDLNTSVKILKSEIDFLKEKNEIIGAQVLNLSQILNKPV